MSSAWSQSTNETISAGAFIVDMGKSPQTRANALRPYGMVYDLLKNYQCPVRWIINDGKAKDGTDFTYNGVNYRGGPFIIPAEFRTSQVNARISYWQGRGVNGITTTAPITVPVFATLLFAPNWTMDAQNGDIATEFFSNAEIPSSAYGGSSSNWKEPSELDGCDDVFVMPHADPEWDSHSNLFFWNDVHLGAIWYGCHAGSALENMFNPSNPSQQTNFLANKTGTATGGGPYDDNALVLWDDHDDASFPLSYDYHDDPMMQFIGTIDDATDNGSEQIFITQSPGWRTSTRVGVFDPDNDEMPSTQLRHRAAVVAWGRGFGDAGRGWLLMQGAHDIAKRSDPDNIAAQRIFFNFGFRALIGKAIIPSIDGLATGTTIAPGDPLSLSVTIPPPANPNDYDVQWSSSCGGTFTPNSTSLNATFTPPNTGGSFTCVISVVITDPCGRETFASESVEVVCDLQISTALTSPCNGLNNGAIVMTVNGGSAPSFSWTRAGGGSGSGSGNTISGLSAGTYTVTVTTSNGCASTFTRTLTASTSINLTATPTNVNCFGETTGSIAVDVSGGTPGFTYAWNDGATTQDRVNLSAGTYSLTVTDANGCTATVAATVNQPNNDLTVAPTVTDVACFGEASGAIDLTVSGGTPAYSYLWSDGVATQNRSGLTTGTYAVTVTDLNGCTEAVTGITVNAPAAALSLSSTQTEPACGAPDGTITVTATGGTAPYGYDWNGTPAGDGSPTITGLSAGSYAVTVTDANGCVAVQTAFLAPIIALELLLEPTNPTCPPAADPPLNGDGAIDLSVVGGTTPYTYNWTTTDGNGLDPAAQDQTGLTAGTYNVTVTDNQGCTISSGTTLVFENELPVTPATINNN